MRLVNKIQYIVLFIIGLLIIGAGSALKGTTLGQNPWKDIVYYIDIGLTYLAIIIIITATMLQQIDYQTSTNEEYIEDQRVIADYAKTEYLPSKFNKYALVANRTRKKNQILFNLRKELAILDKQMKPKEQNIWSFGTKEQKLKNRRCSKRLRLESELQKIVTLDMHAKDLETIQKNMEILQWIENKNVRYDRITSGVVLGGIFSKQDNNSANDFITKDKAWTVVRDRGPMLLLGLGFTTLSSTFILNIIFTPSAIIPILTKLLVLSWQVILILRYAKGYFEKTFLKDIRWRKGVIEECRLWIAQEESNFTEAEKLRRKLLEEKREVKTNGKPNRIVDAIDFGISNENALRLQSSANDN